MQGLVDFWKGFRLLPSAWLLLTQFLILVLTAFTRESPSFRALLWVLGVLVLLIIALYTTKIDNSLK